MDQESVSISHSVADTHAYAGELIARVLAEQGLSGTATIFALSGELGAGKTAFVQGVAKALGIEEVVASPTFVLMKTYDIPETSAAREKFARLVHLDCYRFESASELEALGWHTLATDPKNLIFLEWPEMGELAIPERAREITIEVIDEHTRTIML